MSTFGWCLDNHHSGCRRTFTIGERTYSCSCSCHDQEAGT